MPVQPHKAVSIELASQSANVITWTVVLTNGKTYRVQGYPGSEILMVCGPRRQATERLPRQACPRGDSQGCVG